MQSVDMHSSTRQPSEQAAMGLKVYSTVVKDQSTTWRDCSLRIYPLGKLKLPTGKIVACDPFVDPDKAVELDLTVPAGTYPVDLVIGRRPSGDERIVFAAINFNSGKVVRWQWAAPKGWVSRSAEPNLAYEYGVDSGTGAFFDASGCRLFKGYSFDHPLYQRLLKAKEKNNKPTRDWALDSLDDGSGLNAAVFSSGDGDGAYSSYWGFDENGNVICLVTDFLMLDVD
ncbi:MAG: DUF4241 domain-containing protein [Phycisphaerae bacterium]|nr:DUF4241 domain-containing protein [Phycisphaerae bacterium]